MDKIILFLFLILFPFGQILRIGIIQPIDLVVGLSALYVIFKKIEVPDVFKKLQPFIFFASFSWFLSIFIFHQISVLYGLLYLLRLISYFYFGIYVWNFVRQKKSNQKLILDSLLSLSLISSLFGWIQYFSFPDIKPFFVWGWDIHLFRLVGTFLDPTYLSLIIVFGSIIAIFKRKYIAVLFLLISLIFTYSRAGYLAFFVAIISIIYFNKQLKKLLFLVLGLFLIAFLLPTTKNHSIELFRSFSVVARVDNYKSTLQIFSKSPVFGVGYDNMCLSYNKYIGFQEFSSHACSGSDSSLLFILATTGVIGFMVFVWACIDVFRYTKYNILYTSSAVALLTHSLFSNSMFYPWIMGWIFILLAVG